MIKDAGSRVKRRTALGLHPVRRRLRREAKDRGSVRGLGNRGDVMTSRTIYLGRLLGLYCVIVALVMMSHRQTTVETMTALVHDAPLLFVVSLAGMVAGLAIILTHNVWTGGALPVVVTLVGWIALVKGLLFMFLPPGTSVAYFEALRYGQLFYFYTSSTLVIGLFLTYASFRSPR
jgi:hypothetical protein